MARNRPAQRLIRARDRWPVDVASSHALKYDRSDSAALSGPLPKALSCVIVVFLMRLMGASLLLIRWPKVMVKRITSVAARMAIIDLSPVTRPMARSRKGQLETGLNVK